MWGTKEPSKIVYVNRPKMDSNGKITIYDNGQHIEADYIKGCITKKDICLGKDWNGENIYSADGVHAAEIAGFENRIMKTLIITISENSITKPVAVIKEKLYSYNTLSLLNSMVGTYEKADNLKLHLSAKKSGLNRDGKQLYSWYMIDSTWKYDVDYLRKAGVYDTKGAAKINPTKKEENLKKVIDELFDELCKHVNRIGMFDYDTEFDKASAMQQQQQEEELRKRNDTPPELLEDDVPF